MLKWKHYSTIISDIKLDLKLLSFVKQVSEYTLTPIGNVFKAALGNVQDLIKEQQNYHGISSDINLNEIDKVIKLIFVLYYHFLKYIQLTGNIPRFYQSQ